ncbi:hypothetical protein [Bradyrhizobium liaoningense]|uniref:hypothetical protein n=1 Tax=Bradyrhizobium liaoningense TaxID=43992 RepID=UPI001BAB00D8|nr:hypothetical protein [Bradyrhizobium liaoningense]MBR0719772.1 hypothetical protein [Bradyrhizobium liaoningense]
MLRDGTYAAWFKTPQGEGTGIVHVADGQIWGRDGVMTYKGSLERDGDRFTAVVVTKKHTEGLTTVFGNDVELKLKLTGTSFGKVATYVGFADEFPGVLLEGRLIFNEQQAQASEPHEPPKFDPSKLPKLPKRPVR